VSYRQLFEKLGKSLGSSEAWLVSSMPRGGLQILQPTTLGEQTVRIYSRELQAEDYAGWRVIREQRAVRGEDCWPGGLERSRFSQRLLVPAGLRFMASAPVASPLLPGYQGVLHVFRSREKGDFNKSDLSGLSEIAKEFAAEAETNRSNRLPSECAKPQPWFHRPGVRQIIFNSDFKPVLGGAFTGFDERLVKQIKENVPSRFNLKPGELEISLKWAIPDLRGDLWAFRVISSHSMPALANGPVVFYCLTPEYGDWATVRTSDVAADEEVSRMIPAMQLMRTDFARGPSLNEIAKLAHLSAFHFHRRFSDLMGLTPKHFLSECQTFRCKELLLGGEKTLTEISKICGFAHQSHFTSRFRQSAGLTPTRWRRVFKALRPTAAPSGQRHR
jgi:AraC-like DNA-binding protein